MDRFEKIVKIAKHFKELIPGKRIDLIMDIETVDKEYNLALDSMLEDLNSFDVAHDVLGIYRHLDRKTKKLTGYWSPRFGRPKDGGN